MTPSIPSFHDGYLTGIHVDDSQVTLLLRRFSGEASELVMTGVEALQIDDFKLGNIINDLVVVCGARPAAYPLERLFPPPHSTAAIDYHDAHRSFLADKAAAIEAGHAILLTITPSYGADLFALCKTVELVR